MKTAIQELKSNLVLTKETTKNSFLEIENQEIREVCIRVFEITLNAIIKRIDTELLEMEKEQIIKALIKGHNDCGVFTMQSECDEYYNETFKSE